MVLAIGIFFYLNYPGVRNAFVQHEVALMTPAQREAMQQMQAAQLTMAQATAVAARPRPRLPRPRLPARRRRLRPRRPAPVLPRASRSNAPSPNYAGRRIMRTRIARTATFSRRLTTTTRGSFSRRRTPGQSLADTADPTACPKRRQ